MINTEKLVLKKTQNLSVKNGLIHQKIYRKLNIKRLPNQYPLFAEKYNADKVLINAEKSLFAISPKLQDWINKNTVPKYIEAGVLKLAIVLAEELYTGISIEQVIDNSIKNTQKRVRYFGNETNA